MFRPQLLAVFRELTSFRRLQLMRQQVTERYNIKYGLEEYLHSFFALALDGNES